MKAQVAVLILMGMVPSVNAEVVSSGGLLRGDAPAETPAPPPLARDAVKPAAAVAPVVQKSTQPAPVAVNGSAPFAPTVAKDPSRCPDPVDHPEARNTPVTVFVNQATQTVEIVSPDRPMKPIKTSTGGGLKIPSVRSGKPIYCAKTPPTNDLIVSAVTEDMFKGTGCDSEAIRAKSTVFDTYKSRTFTDDQGKEVPLPKAVRVFKKGGIFFHTAPSKYVTALGLPVSGECIRLSSKDATFLNQQVRKYGAIKVTISERPVYPKGHPGYCDNQMIAQAKNETQGGNVAPANRQTGSEGIYGMRGDDPLTALGKWFGFVPQEPQKPAAAPAASRTPAKKVATRGNVQERGSFHGN